MSTVSLKEGLSYLPVKHLPVISYDRGMIFERVQAWLFRVAEDGKIVVISESTSLASIALLDLRRISKGAEFCVIGLGVNNQVIARLRGFAEDLIFADGIQLTPERLSNGVSPDARAGRCFLRSLRQQTSEN